MITDEIRRFHSLRPDGLPGGALFLVNECNRDFSTAMNEKPFAAPVSVVQEQFVALLFPGVRLCLARNRLWDGLHGSECWIDDYPHLDGRTWAVPDNLNLLGCESNGQ